MKRLAPIIAMFLLLAGCAGSPTSEPKGDNGGSDPTTTETTASEAPAADGVTAEFKMTSTSSKASVSWGTGAGMSQDEIKKATWSKKVKLDDSFDIASLTVTSSDYLKSEKVTCEILINGVSKSKNSAKGKMAIASCSANTTD